jgi:hypothetical protein
MKTVPVNLAKSVAGVFALAGFLVAVTSGLIWGLDATSVLMRALIALGVCYVVGTIAGEMLESLARDANKQYEEQRPIPALLRPSAGSTTDSGGGEGRAMGGGEAEVARGKSAKKM